MSARFCSVFRLFSSIVLLSLCFAPGAAGADNAWPAYLHDGARSGATTMSLAYPLEVSWVYRPRHAPDPAWPAPAPYDYWHKLRDLKPVVVYDRVHHAVIADGKLCFGLSAEDKVCGLDAKTGQLLFESTAEAPVRLAPTLADGHVYFGSDDGKVRCFSTRTANPGEFFYPGYLWERDLAPEDRRIPGNGRVISVWPVRTGVLVDKGVAYCCAGLLPNEGVYVYALDAKTGETIWKQEAKTVSPQGYLLASEKYLFVPTGRTNPAVFDRKTGAFRRELEGGGGTFAVLADDSLVAGPGRQTGNELQFSGSDGRHGLATAEGIRMVVDGDMAYIHTKEAITALDRKRFVSLSSEWAELNSARARAERKLEILEAKDATENAEAIAELRGTMDEMEPKMGALARERKTCYRWTQPDDYPYALILAGDCLVAGGDGRVAAFDKTDGAPRWQAEVDGRAYGLSAAEGRLYVSTDTGAIYCFDHAPGQKGREILPAVKERPFGEDGHGEEYRLAAEEIIAQTGMRKGYCLVLDVDDGRLAYEIARQTEMQVVAVFSDASKYSDARWELEEAGYYGKRVSLHLLDGARLPYTSYMFNLIVSEGALNGRIPRVPSEEVWRVLGPYGGQVCLGQPEGAANPLDKDALAAWAGALLASPETIGAWLRASKGPVEGAGEWTQLYCDASHTAASDEQLRGPMAVQWFGEPGPRRIIDRHHRPMSPLFKNGQLYITGNEVIYAADPYNGSPRWELEVPDSRRIGALKNCGHILVTDELLYVSREDECWAVEPETGKVSATFKAPQAGDDASDWGYLNCAGNRLVGSGQCPGASFSKMSEMTCAILEGDNRLVMVSRYLFAVDRFSGAADWVYQKGAIINSAIAMDESKVYFIEARGEDARGAKDGRIGIAAFCRGDTFLVALDLETGRPVWERAVDLRYEHIMYLNGDENVLLVSGTYNEGDQVFYGFHAYAMDTGEPVWDNAFRALDIRGNEFSGVDGTHGEQWQHPVLMGGVAYARPFAFDLHTGEKRDYIARRGGHGCGGLTGSAHYLYGRGSVPRMYPIDVPETDGIPVTRVSRPGCWLNMIPAGGMLLVPESSSGCTCAYALQTSFGFIPRSVAAPE